MAETVIELENAPEGVDVRPGERLRVRLPENPTTGYRWEVDPADQGVVECTGAELHLPPSPATGAGGVREFHLAVRGPGVAEVRFTRRRPWGKEEPAQTLRLQVRSR